MNDSLTKTVEGKKVELRITQHRSIPEHVMNRYTKLLNLIIDNLDYYSILITVSLGPKMISTNVYCDGSSFNFNIRHKKNEICFNVDSIFYSKIIQIKKKLPNIYSKYTFYVNKRHN
jgi:hypothetical protein